MLERKLTYIFSSDPVNGAVNRSPGGDRFTVNLYEPIRIPPMAHYCLAEVQAANIWNVVPNISAALGNNIFRYSDTVTGYHTLTIPDGLYDLTQLANTLAILIDNLGVPLALPSNECFSFSGDQATQRVYITFLSNGLIIDWVASTVRSILGFLTSSTGSVNKGETVIGDEIARFNTLTSFLIHADFLHTGIPVNSTATGVIANVFIDSPPGSLINYVPNVVPSSNADELVGASLPAVTFSLTDQTNTPVDTNGEFWQFTLVIRYWM